MRPRRSNEDYLRDILTAAGKAESFLGDLFDF